jgi:hypothetical protein
MTKHKIDDLFKQKLAGSEFTPSPAAWSKLESKLVQKKKKGIIFWMSAAASIALLLTFGWLMLKPNHNVSSVEQIAQNNDIKTSTTPPIDSVKSQDIVDIIQDKDIESTPIEKPESNEQVKNNNTKVIKTQKIKKPSAPLILIQQKSNLATNNKPVDSPKDTIDEAVIDLKEIPEGLVISTDETLAINDPIEQIITPSSKESGSIKIVYTLKPVITSESIAQEAENKTKLSPFKKAVAFAKNVKENPKGIGSLREAKNNFLSLNKKKNGSK